MNTQLIKSDISRLTLAHKKMFLDYLLFLHWTERPFKGVFELMATADDLAGLPRRKAIGLYCMGCILRGALEYIRFHGITDGWLRITGLWRAD